MSEIQSKENAIKVGILGSSGSLGQSFKYLSKNPPTIESTRIEFFDDEFPSAVEWVEKRLPRFEFTFLTHEDRVYLESGSYHGRNCEWTNKLLSLDLFIDCSAYNDVDGAEENPLECIQSNVIRKLNIARFFGDKVRCIAYTSDLEPLSAEDVHGVYGYSKLGTRMAYKNANPNNIIIRVGNVVGPFGTNFFTKLMGKRNHSEVFIPSDIHGIPTSALALAEYSLQTYFCSVATDETPYQVGEVPLSRAELAECFFFYLRELLGSPTPVAQGFKSNPKAHRKMIPDTGGDQFIFPMKNFCDLYTEIVDIYLAKEAR